MHFYSGSHVRCANIITRGDHSAYSRKAENEREVLYE